MVFPSLEASLRTLCGVALGLPPIATHLALDGVVSMGSTTTASGLDVARRRFTFLLRCLGVELDIRGHERVPVSGGVVFMWNQESHLEHFVVPCAIPRPFFLIYNNEVARFPLYGSHLQRRGHVHVDRHNSAQWRAAIAGAAARVREGECVLVSPEGTRSRDGKLLPMKSGAFSLALESGRPVVCVTLTGAHERLPRGGRVVRPGTIRVELSEPIAVDGSSDAARAELERAVITTFAGLKQHRGGADR